MNTMHDLLREDPEAYIAAVEGFGEHITLEVPGLSPYTVSRPHTGLWVWITDGDLTHHNRRAFAAVVEGRFEWQETDR